MATRRLGGIATSSSVPDNGGDHSGGGGSGGSSKYVDDVFQTTLTEGLGNETIVNGMDLLDKGALIWQKSRIQGSPHFLYDSERGAGKAISCNDTGAEQNFGSSGVQSWNNDGWTAGSGGTSSGGTTAQWVFAKQKGFFDIVTYTGNDVAGREIPHNLGSEPGMIWIKSTTSSDNWQVFNKYLPNPLTKRLYLNESLGEQNQSSSPQFPAMPTDAVFTVGDDTSVNYGGSLGGDAREYVAYLFADDAPMFGPNGDESIIKCGSYTGNGSDDGPEIDLGWEPQWLLVKNATASAKWNLIDTMRGTTPNRGYDNLLYPNTKDAEETWRVLYPTATGFKVDDSGSSWNGSGNTYIYMAIRRPNKPAEEFEPEELFALSNQVATEPNSVAGFPVDMGIRSLITGNANYPMIMSRLTQGQSLQTSSTRASDTNSNYAFDYNDGFMTGGGATTDLVAHMFRRAPGFFDVVTYTGDDVSGRELPHNLAAMPEMMWVKNTTTARSWQVYSKTLGSGKCMVVDNTNGAFDAAPWNDTDPNNSMFSVSNGLDVNQSSQNYIAYLWASVPGICDIGSFTSSYS